MNDPVAMTDQGTEQYDEGDYRSAFEYFAKAATLGDAEAHCKLACLYYNGLGVEKDNRKYSHHLEEAAIRGHLSARYYLGCNEWQSDNTPTALNPVDISATPKNNFNAKKAVKHWIIAAKQGDDRSIKALMKVFKGGFVRKEELAAVLRAHHAAVEGTKSPQREDAEKFYRANQHLL